MTDPYWIPPTMKSAILICILFVIFLSLALTYEGARCFFSGEDLRFGLDMMRANENK